MNEHSEMRSSVIYGRCLRATSAPFVQQNDKGSVKSVQLRGRAECAKKARVLSALIHRALPRAQWL